MTGPNKPIASIQTTLKLIEALKRSDGAGVTELAREIGVSKGTVHNHLTTLEHEDFVVKRDNKYYVGFRFLDVAHFAKRRVKMYEVVREEVDNLAERTGEMALYTCEEHGLGVCLYLALGENAVQTPLHVGQRETLHHTAVGKAILAHLPEDRVWEIIKEYGLERKTNDTITDPDELFNELETIREEGFAYSDGETIPGLAGIGAPVTDQRGELIGGTAVIGPTSRMDEERYREITEAMTHSINIIELNATAL